MAHSIEFTHEERAAASAWHGGQGSMLYAISSTGSLKIGSIRPHGCESDREHFIGIARELFDEASDCAALENGPMRDDLMAIAVKCCDALRALGEEP
jgi:hypothetical protein